MNYNKNIESDLLTPTENEVPRLKDEIRRIQSSLNIFKTALNSSLNSTVITNLNGNIIWVNKAFTILTGYTYEEAINQNPKILKSGKHPNKFYKNMWDTILAGNIWEGEITNKKKNGTLYHEKLIISPVFNEYSEITNFIATKQDITSQKEIDIVLNESYIKYEELAYIFNQSPAIGFLWSEEDDRSVEFVTDNIKQWGYTPKEFYTHQLKLKDIIYEDDRNSFFDQLEKEINSGSESFKQQFRIITKSGESRWVDSHLFARLGENDSITHLQGVVLDVTEQKNAEDESKYQLEQLMQADKMIALGTLVSGVAHEINNPNNFVILNIPLIEKVWFNILPILDSYHKENGDYNVGERLKYSKIKESMPLLLGGINEGATRIKNIVEDLKSFARKDFKGCEQKVDLNKVLQTSVNLTANLISKSTDNFHAKYIEQPIFVKGSKQKLEQVLINLIENSCQSLENRKKSVKIELNKNCKEVSIIISDEGKGMEQETLRKITDPFFTTKRNNGGTGLGLSIASKIILQHGGSLVFESSPNNGTTATICLPIWSES